ATRNTIRFGRKSRHAGLPCLQLRSGGGQRDRNNCPRKVMLLREIADRGCQVTFEGLPHESVATAKQAMLDTMGCTSGGPQEGTTALVARTLRVTEAPGTALIFGSSERLDVLSAALINGGAAHALDFDDCSNTLGGHPSAPILPALWTLAPGASGRAFIAAYAAGVECECRLAPALPL